MPGKHGLHLFTAVSLFAGAGLFQFATPLAISAQSRATIQVGATVVPASGAWEADAMVAALAAELGRELTARPRLMSARAGYGADAFTSAHAPGTVRAPLTLTALAGDLRREWRGTALWVEPPRSGSPGTVTITVAHLAY